jgi:hypothetical protein
MKCKRHSWVIRGARRLDREIRRGQQVANAETYVKCIACGAEKRTGLMHVHYPSQAVGQSNS